MQLAVIEFARHVAGIEEANSGEFKPQGKTNVIDLMEAQKAITEKGGTMRLGAYLCKVLPRGPKGNTKAYEAYGVEEVNERHRHRFEFANQYKPALEKAGLLISGKYVDTRTGLELVEIVELPDHPWFVGVQFHPEFLSKPLAPHPLFAGFVKAALNRKSGGV
jgi:CTP synthase